MLRKRAEMRNAQSCAMRNVVQMRRVAQCAMLRKCSQLRNVAQMRRVAQCVNVGTLYFMVSFDSEYKGAYDPLVTSVITSNKTLIKASLMSKISDFHLNKTFNVG